MFLLFLFLAGCPKEASEKLENSCHVKKSQELELTFEAISCHQEALSSWIYCISYPSELQGHQFKTAFYEDRCYILTP